jgi:hypothetical protein
MTRRLLTMSFVQDIGSDIKFSYGLHRKCSTVTGTCEPFPSDVDCQAAGPGGGAGGQTFCALWRTVGFGMSFSVIIELATWTAFAVILLGGVQQRNKGWKVVCGLLAVCAIVQAAAMSVVVRYSLHSRWWKINRFPRHIYTIMTKDSLPQAGDWTHHGRFAR